MRSPGPARIAGLQGRVLHTFDVETFIADCCAALDEPQPRTAIKELLDRAICAPSAVEAALPASIAELCPIYHSADLTIMKVIWAPGMAVPPHDHLMWAAIGIYGGEEDNTFFTRGPEGITAGGGKQLITGDTTLLGDDVIHAVVNPRRHSYTAAIHIYGGDFLNKPRSMWDPETLQQEPATAKTMSRFFEQANENNSAAGA